MVVQLLGNSKMPTENSRTPHTESTTHISGMCYQLVSPLELSNLSVASKT